MTYVLFKFIHSTYGLRVTSDEEHSGLDKEEHGTESYADFQPRLMPLNSDSIKTFGFDVETANNYLEP